MLVRLSRWLPLAVVALAGLWLRTHALADRPMHADEANQAVKAGELLEHGRYAFDPRDHHGPTLYYAVLPIAWLRGEHTLASLSESTVRLVPAIAGTIAILLLASLARPLGTWTSLAAAAFVAISPPAIYYSRYFIQESLLLTFFLASLLAARAWWGSGKVGWAVAAGASVGLMQATKASTPVFLAAAAIACLVVHPAPSRRRSWGTALLCGFGGMVLVAGLFYSSFGTHLSGLRDAFAVYGPAADRAVGVSGHEKPWWYYLRLFGWHREGGLLWQQLAFVALALCGVGVAFLRKSVDDDETLEQVGAGLDPLQLTRWAAVYTGLLGLILSLAPYKTPWHAIHFVPGLSLLAASAIRAFPSWRRAVIVTGVVIFLQYSQVKLAVYLRPSDSRNPYAYVHSAPDVVKFRAAVDQALVANPAGVVRVIGAEYWPIPWYLRGVTQVGYWSSAPKNCDALLVIAIGDQTELVRSRLQGSYRESILGLRPGVLCTVFTRKP